MDLEKFQVNKKDDIRLKMNLSREIGDQSYKFQIPTEDSKDFLEGRIFELRGRNAAGKSTALRGLALSLGHDYKATSSIGPLGFTKTDYEDTMEDRFKKISSESEIETVLEVGENSIQASYQKGNSEASINDSLIDPSQLGELVDIEYISAERIAKQALPKGAFEEIMNIIDNLRNEGKSFQGELKETISEIQEYQNFESLIEKKEEKVEELREVKKESQREVEDLEEKKNDLEQAMNLKNSIEESNKYEKLKEQKNELEREIEELKSKLESEETGTKEKVEEDLEIERSNLEKLKKEYKKLEERKQQLSDSLEERANKHTKWKDLIEERDVEELEKKKEEIGTSLRKSQFSKLGVSKDVLQEMQKAIRNHPLNIELPNWEGKESISLRMLLKKVNRSKETVNSLKGEEKEKEEELKSEYESLDDILDSIKEIRETEKEIEEINPKISNLEEEVEDLKKELGGELPREDEIRQKISQKEMEFEKTKEKLEELKDSYKHKKETQEQLSEILSKYEIDSGNLEENFQELQGGIEARENEARKYEERVKELKNEIEKDESRKDELKEPEYYQEREVVEEIYRVTGEVQDDLSQVEDGISTTYQKVQKGEWENPTKQNIKEAFGPLVAQFYSIINESLKNKLKRIWTDADGWVDVTSVDIFKKRLVYETEDSEEGVIDFTDLSQGQGTLSLIQSALSKESKGKYKVLLIDEIGDLDPDRYKEIIGEELKPRLSENLLFSILVRPDAQAPTFETLA